jgi:hypothetical protein
MTRTFYHQGSCPPRLKATFLLSCDSQGLDPRRACGFLAINSQFSVPPLPGAAAVS